MLTKRLRYDDLLDLNIIHNRTTLNNWIRDRGFPAGQLTGPNTRTWGEDEVQRWLDSRPIAPKPPPPKPERRGRPRKSPLPATPDATEPPKPTPKRRTTARNTFEAAE